jgi:hypothetical protein
VLPEITNYKFPNYKFPASSAVEGLVLGSSGELPAGAKIEIRKCLATLATYTCDRV